MASLAISCEMGGVLGVVAPLALAAAAGTALVVDLDVDGPHYPGEGSLAGLVAQGPRLDDLRPKHQGIAVLRNGGIKAADAEEVVRALISGWPNTVLRLPRGTLGSGVPVVPLLPGGLTPAVNRPAVYQQVGWHEKAPGPAVCLPTPARSVVGALLEGRQPTRNRWISSWRDVWELAWV